MLPIPVRKAKTDLRLLVDEVYLALPNLVP
jgi:hypothetical protein